MTNQAHWKKMIAPAIITALFLLYLIIYGGFLLQALAPAALLFAIPLVLLGIGSVYTLVTRIREIRSGEEDDLDNY